nr:tyrosine-type recombinase/integrase [Desulfogranum mediterraneum]
MSTGNRGTYIFTNSAGRFLSDNTLRRVWSRTCQKIGIGHRRLHDIRHTTASVLLMRGKPITFVSKLLEHSSPQITMRVYAHYLPSDDDGFIDALSTGENRDVGGSFDGNKDRHSDDLSVVNSSS